ncbi:pyridoxamine 5'-phosphate oxidase family protein [Pseudonocardia sp. GCM10023141]|uniref:pyridoxamine 5'-phosphate oxidase family protein n=1 Tax=Pseudonocardia sp. GCM10023141 TaxID=3252653 RepID=UPI00360FFF80
MALTESDRAELLAEPVSAVLSVDAGECRGPLSVPLWFVHDTASGDLLMTTEEASRKVRLLRAAGSATFLVQRSAPTMRYAAAEGAVSFSPTDRDLLYRIVDRYLPAEHRDHYVARSAVDSFVTVRLSPRRWIGGDLGPAASLPPVEG